LGPLVVPTGVGLVEDGTGVDEKALTEVLEGAALVDEGRAETLRVDGPESDGDGEVRWPLLPEHALSTVARQARTVASATSLPRIMGPDLSTATVSAGRVIHRNRTPRIAVRKPLFA
jgi:hypothetical protein